MYKANNLLDSEVLLLLVWQTHPFFYRLASHKFSLSQKLFVILVQQARLQLDSHRNTHHHWHNFFTSTSRKSQDHHILHNLFQFLAMSLWKSLPSLAHMYCILKQCWYLWPWFRWRSSYPNYQVHRWLFQWLTLLSDLLYPNSWSCKKIRRLWYLGKLWAL